VTKLELIELIRNDMLEAVKNRDKSTSSYESEVIGYFNGQYRAYESIVKLLMMFEIEEIDVFDARFIRT
jgi:hypothetical protein